ncbi:myosin tail domain protein [Ceratobasidium sp. AG-Ba]|nr:myosin tail domain protein [Ceratobasidium sp. AG-Ba]
MIIDVSDPAILGTYLQIKQGTKHWLILAYTKARDALRLVDSGDGGPDTLRDHLIPYSKDVSFALVRDQSTAGLVLVCLIPSAIGGVKRARAIVHERALEDVFPDRRAVLNVASEAEITAGALERVLHSSALPARQPGLPSHPQIHINRPMSPPRSSEEGYSIRASPRPPPPFQPQERGLPLNLPEPLDPERQHEIDRAREEELAKEKQARTPHMPSPGAGGNPTTKTLSPRVGKPQLSVAVPPRGERGLQPMKYDGDQDEEDDDENEDDDDSPDQENLILRTHSRPSSRGPTPPPGPSILRHPSPIPPRPDSGVPVPSTSHIRFTGPPKDHPHPDHHPLKSTDQILSFALLSRPSTQTTQLSYASPNALVAAQAPLDGRPAPVMSAYQRTTSTSSIPEEVAVPPVSSSSSPPVVASSSLNSSITWQSASQPGQPFPVHPRYGPPTISTIGFSNRPLPPQPPSTFSVRPAASNTPGLVVHSRNASASTTPGQTHVPSGTLCAFGRRTSVSSVQQNGSTSPNPNPSSALLAQMNLASPTSLLERSSTTTSGVTSSSTSTTAHRPMQAQTQGMTEAQLQAARSRAKWAAEEQGITVPPQPISNGSLPRSPPLTPPTSPPRSLSVEEAGRVRRDGAEKMRREAERRREEEEKKKNAEERRRIEAEQQLKLDREKEAQEEKEKSEREEKRKEAEIKRRAMEEEQDKRRAGEKVQIREKFQQARGTDEVFLSGHVNIQPENAMTWKWRFYELTASGRLSLYKSSDASDRVKPLDIVNVKDAVRINRSADELELISFAFRLEFGEDRESWSFYSDSQHDMDVLTEGITWTMGL